MCNWLVCASTHDLLVTGIAVLVAVITSAVLIWIIETGEGRSRG